MTTNPQQLFGNWKEGWALDFHTTSSVPVKDTDGNITSWNTVRPEIAEELYRLKYWKEQFRVEAIAQPAAMFLMPKVSLWQLDLIIPIPPSDTTRLFQPVYELAKSIGNKINLSVDFTKLVKIKSTAELKSIEDEAKRKEILKDAFFVQAGSLQGKDVLLVDDLYRSGESLKACTNVLLNNGKARNVYVLTITKTRSKK
jgi:predicted amidophosphoribosyltransferase